MTRILVTGVNGFVGKHLAREIHNQGHEIIGIGSRENTPDEEITGLLESYHRCDVTDKKMVSELPLDKVGAVINLAGLANVGASFDQPELYMRVNTQVLSVLGGALLRANPNARMIAVSTGALYDPSQTMPLKEDSAVITEGSPYALSKLAMEQSAQELREKGQDCVVVRPFNHIGPGQGPGFLIPDMISKLQKYKQDGTPVSAGNLKTIRDYSDVRDIARAYAHLATTENLEHYLYNVCSGIGRSGGEIVQTICKELDIDYDKLEIEVDQSLIRPTDPPKIIGDHSRLSEDTGWQPTYNLKDTVQSIIAK